MHKPIGADEAFKLSCRIACNWAWLCACLIFAPWPVSAETLTLNLAIDKINKPGGLHVAIYDDPKVFGKANGKGREQVPGMIAARVLQVTEPSATLTFNLPPGQYAIALYNDENGNGKLDTVFGIPREQFGFSNNAMGRLGPPSFEQASITITSENSQVDHRIELN